MRALPTFAIGAVVLLAINGMIAILGRGLDWSPYALTIAGALTGLSFGVALTILLYVTGEDDEDSLAETRCGNCPHSPDAHSPVGAELCAHRGCLCPGFLTVHGPEHGA